MRVDEDGGDAQPVGHPAGVLATCTAEAHQRVGGDVVASLGADLADRIGHVLRCDLAVPECHLRGAAPHAGGVSDLVRQRGDAAGGGRDIERLRAIGAEHRREVLGPDDAEHGVGVGERERSAVAVTGGAGICAGRLGPDPQAAAVEREQRAAAGRDRVHVDDGCANPDARYLGRIGSLELAGEVGDVGRRSAHVKADDALEAGGLRDPGHAHHAAGGP